MKTILITFAVLLVLSSTFSQPVFASKLIGPQIEINTAYTNERMDFIKSLECDLTNISSSRIKVIHRRSYMKIMLEMTPTEDIYIVDFNSADKDYGQVENPDILISSENVSIVYDIPSEENISVMESSFIPHSWLLKKVDKTKTFKSTYYFRKPFKENLAFAAEEKRSFTDKNINFVLSYIPAINQEETIVYDDENPNQKYLKFSINTRGSFIARPCQERRSSQKNSLQTVILTGNDYAFSPTDPIILGNGDMLDGPGLSYSFLDTLTGPNGEEVTWKRVQACCQFETPFGLEGSGGKKYGLLDRYEL